MFTTLFHFKRARHVHAYTQKSAVPRASLSSPDCIQFSYWYQAGYGARWYQVLFELLKQLNETSMCEGVVRV